MLTRVKLNGCHYLKTKFNGIYLYSIFAKENQATKYQDLF